jgi:hypothetical protein
LIDGMLSVVSPDGLGRRAAGGSCTPVPVGAGVVLAGVGVGAALVARGSGTAVVSEQPAMTASSPASASPVVRMGSTVTRAF